jgi:Xaa-Pro aminopeptidase
VQDRGLDNARVGIELDEGLRVGMTQKEFQGLAEQLPLVRWESCSHIAWRIAEIKSEAEKVKLRQAARITNSAFERAFECARIGMTEKELASIIFRSYFENGATDAGFLAVIAGRERGIWADALPSDYRIQKGDLLMIDGGCRVDGYYADVSRMASFGEPSKSDRAYYEAARRANANAVASAKPGVAMSELFSAGQQPFIEAGFEDLLVLGNGQLGHGIGLSLHEYPDISSHSTKQLKPGMAIAIEPAISNKPEWAESSQFYIVENNVIITEDGCEMLTTLDDDLQILG